MTDASKHPLGEERITVRRSLKGVVVGIAFMLAICGALLGWNFLVRSSTAVAVMAVLLTVVMLVALSVFLSVPDAIAFHESGLVVSFLRGRNRIIRFHEVTEVTLRRAPQGKRPLIVSIAFKDGPSVTLSEAEYQHVPAAVGLLSTALPDLISDRGVS